MGSLAKGISLSEFLFWYGSMKHHHYLLNKKNLHVSGSDFNLNNSPNSDVMPLYRPNFLEYFLPFVLGAQQQYTFFIDKELAPWKFHFQIWRLCLYIDKNDYHFIAKIDGRGNARHYGLVVIT